MFLNVFAEEADIGEIQLEGNLFNGEVGLQQVVFDMGDDAFCYPIQGRSTALFLTDRAEVLRSDQQLFGVGPDFALGVCRMTEQGDEPLEQKVFL